MILFINTSEQEAQIALISSDKVDHINFLSQRISEDLLPNIQKLLKRNKTKLSALQKIAVIIGPGPFSRIRTAVVTANALAYALQILVAGIKGPSSPLIYQRLRAEKAARYKKFPEQVLPFYSKPPNITAPGGIKGRTKKK